ncbi:hypothetical protein SZ54_2029 [Rhizobium sp. UR51a]|nr:hypothetical protein SZ54_2029 [Rhizobium sp. UR51a]
MPFKRPPVAKRVSCCRRTHNHDFCVLRVAEMATRECG